jgi:hypothetical protein
MTPPISKEQTEYLHNLYYDKGYIFGRDKLYQYIRSNDEMKISRRQIGDWLKKQEINQLHQPHSQPKSIKSTVLEQPHITLAIDLVDMQNLEVKGYKYLLNGVDLFSRKLYSEAIKNKEDKTVLTAFKKIVKKIPDLQSVRSDNGSEFIANIFKTFLKKDDIKQILSSPYKPTSNGNIERFNQTLKRLLHKNIELNKDYDWVKNLQSMVDNINSTFVDSLNDTPDNIEKLYKNNDEEGIAEIHNRDKKEKSNTITTQKFNIDDVVRIYEPNDLMKSKVWSEETYEVQTVYKPKNDYSVYEYKLKTLKKKFKDEDLQLLKHGVENKIQTLDNSFIVSKIVSPMVHENEEYYEVSWKGYRGQNTIEPKAELMKDIPKMINLFEKKHKVKWVENKSNRLKLSWSEK